MFRKCGGIIQLFLVLFSIFAKAQTLQFNSLDIKDGLSQNSVLSISQDKRGFLWIGTRDGLNRYDSHRFLVYRTDSQDSSSISNNYVTALLTDSKGHLWAGTRKGLNLYDPVKNTFRRIGGGKADLPIGRNVVSQLYEDRKGRVWVATEGALYVIEFISGQMKPRLVPISSRRLVFRSVFQDEKGSIWLGTAAGLLKLSEKKGMFKVEVPVVPDPLRNVPVTSFFQDQFRNLWIGTAGNGLFVRESGKGTFQQFVHQKSTVNSLANNNVRRLMADGKGQLLIGTQEGLSALDLTGRRFTNYVHSPWDKHSLSQNSIHSLFKDNAGNIWIGTFFGGLNSFYAYNTPFEIYSTRSLKNPLNNNVISSIIETRNELWIGTEGGGINCLSKTSGKRSLLTFEEGNTSSLGSNLVKVIYKDKQGDLWVGTHGGGLNLFHPDSKSFTRYLLKNGETFGAEITALLEDASGNFWVGTETAGLNTFRKSGKDLVSISIPGISNKVGKTPVLALWETSDKQIWFGGPEGLYIIKGSKLRKVSLAGRSDALHINSIVEDRNGKVWVGSNDGLLLFDLKANLQARYSSTDGLADDHVLGIIPYDNQEIWISTAKGLSRFNSAHKIFYNYTETDGVAGAVFNNNSYFRSSEGKFYFGGYNGLTSFYPQQIEINTLQSPLYITSLKVNNQEQLPGMDDSPLDKDITFTRTLKLEYDQNVFSVDFAILNFIKPDKNAYQYKLKGYDNEWKNAQEPSVTFTRVPSGDYKLLLRAKNNDSNWVESSVLEITVLPPLWKRWWAYAFYLLLLSALAFFGVRHMILKALFEKNKEITQLKLNFFTNISHEIRTHLSLIIGPAENLLREGSADLREQQQLTTIKNNSESLLKLVTELMDFRKAETGYLQLQVMNWDVLSVLRVVVSSYYEIALSKNIEVLLNCTQEKLDLYVDKEQLEKVFYNLLSNAFKFTPQNGQIDVTVEEDEQGVKISVSNSGKGISPENVSKLFDNYFQEDDHGRSGTGYGIGLALSKSIAELHCGALSVSSIEREDDRLTSFTLQLLKGKKHFNSSWIQSSSEALKEEPLTREELSSLEMLDDGERQIIQNPQHTVLIAEDNPEIRNLIKNSLQGMFKIYESADGVEALDLAGQHLPDLIITDLMMPEMDGLEFCRRVKSEESTRHIPVFMLTAKNTRDNQISGLETGADIYITKPFSPRALFLQIENFFKNRELLWKRFAETIRSQPLYEEPSLQQPGIHPLDQAFLTKITGFVQENVGEPEFGVAALSKMAAMSQPVLFKKIKALTGLSANEFVKAIRMRRAAELLLENHYTVYEVSYMVGYDNSKYFSKEFKKHFNINPSEYYSNRQAND